jgi:hypothetical protein
MTMGRPAAAAAALALGAGLVLGLATPAGADPDGSSGNGTFGFSDSQGVPLGSEVPDFSGGGGPPVTYSVDFFEGVAPEEGTFENEDGCWGATVAEGQSGQTWAEVQATLAEYNDAQAWGVCAAEETFDLVAYVEQMWQSEVAPPPPTPLVVNNDHGALTGLTAYLEIGGDPNPTQTIPNPIGPDIVITMTPRYVVHWGDGSSTETTSQGGPPRGGDLTHTWIDEGTVEVTVEAYWHATWSAGAVGGDLPELPTPTSETEPVLVEQYQAVIDPN